MNPSDNLENSIQKLRHPADALTVNRIRSHVLYVLDEMNQKPADEIHPPESKWRSVMKTKLFRYAAAAVLMFAAITAFSALWTHSAQPAWAIEQTIEALRNIQAVHIFGRDWEGRELEMWLAVNPETGKYDYTFMKLKDKYLAVSTPSISYQYYPDKNRVAVLHSQLFHNDLRFEQTIENFVRDVSEMDGEKREIKIFSETDPTTQKTVLVILTEHRLNSFRINIDPDTKRPISIHCLRSELPGQAVKDFDEIYYYEDFPTGIFEFEIPEGATVVDKDHESELLNDPQYGVPCEGRSQEEVIPELITIYWRAIFDEDMELLWKVHPVDADKCKTKEGLRESIEKQYGDNKPIELLEVGISYVEHQCGYGPVTPCVILYKDGTKKEHRLISKFREIEGKGSWIIAGTWGDPKQIQ